MSEKGANEQGPVIEQRSHKRRDDTPSFIRNVQTRMDARRNPNSGQYQSVIPVMEVPRSIRIWRTVQWPLLIFVVAVILAIAGFVTNDILVSRSVAKRIEDARTGESLGAIETVTAAGRSLSQLAADYPSRGNAQAAWAWHAVLEANWFGPQEKLVADAEKALDGADPSEPSTTAARAGLACLKGKPQEALALLDASPGLQDPRMAMVRVWAQAGQRELGAALGTIETAIKAYPQYVPLVVEGMRTAVLADDAAQATRWMTRLRDILPDHLWATLVQVSFSLPRWGESQAPSNSAKAAVSALQKLSPDIEAAPLQLRLLGQLLIGRALLAAGDASAATETIQKVLEAAPTAEHLAWLCLAVTRRYGPAAAIELLDHRRDLTGALVLDAHAQALLALHRVDDAKPLIEALVKSGELPDRARFLSFVLAVRTGAVDAALGRLPERLTGDAVWPALELYEQVARLGRTTDVDDVVGAIAEADESCGAALRAWHGKWDREALRSLRRGSLDSPCTAALRAIFLFGQEEPKAVLEAATAAALATNNGLRNEISRGLAVFLAEGHAKGAEVLAAVAAAKPQGSPLKVLLGRAYLRLGLANEALAAVNEDASEEALALRIDASAAPAQTRLIAEAAQRFTAQPHPALAYYAALTAFRADKHQDVAAFAANAEKLGAFAPRVGTLVARSLTAMGEKRDADRTLEQLCRSLRASAGAGAAWDAKTELVLLNLKRGAKYTFRALGLISELTSQGVRSAELLYAYAMANFKQGNEAGAPRFLREALEIDPSHLPTCQQLAAMGKLEDPLRAACLSTHPNLSL